MDVKVNGTYSKALGDLKGGDSFFHKGFSGGDLYIVTEKRNPPSRHLQVMRLKGGELLWLHPETVVFQTNYMISEVEIIGVKDR